jgi:alcohol dehydrogenase class IV
MPMTRKVSRKSRAAGSSLARYNVTFHNLHEWRKAEFEKLGWMVLAKAKGMKSKTNQYKKSIKALKQSIEKAKHELKEPDRLRDLNIMMKQVDVLQKHVNKDFH